MGNSLTIDSDPASIDSILAVEREHLLHVHLKGEVPPGINMHLKMWRLVSGEDDLYGQRLEPVPLRYTHSEGKDSLLTRTCVWRRGARCSPSSLQRHQQE
jgi:hypothetical protein